MDKLRDFLKGWFGRVLMVACLAPMVFLGMEGYLGGGRLTADQVAKVGDTVISLSEVQGEVNAARANLTEQLDASLIDEQALKAQTLDTVINRTLFETQATKLGMQVSDTMITALLQQDPTFFDADGKFSNDRFAMYLTQRGLTKDRLFAMQRRQLNLRMLMNGVLSNVIYPNSQISRLLDLQSESRELWVKRLNWQPYAERVSVSDADISAYYDSHKDTFVRPNLVDLAYMELVKDNIDVPAPTDDDLKGAYQAYLRTNNLGQKQLAQILFTGDDAKARAEAVQKELTAGKDFGELAKQSDDPSGKTGGDIGAYNPAVFGADAEKVDKAIATLGKGDVSELVETGFGVHLFKVTGVADAPSFDSLKETLTKQWRQDRQEALFKEQVFKVNTLVADGFGLKDIAAELKLTMKDLPNYQDKNQAVMGQPAIIAAAFDETTIADGAVSGNVDLVGVTLWVQPSNYRPSAPMSLDEAKADIKARLITEKASELALADAENQAKNFTPADLTKFTAIGVASRQTPVLNESERSSLFIKDSDGDKPAVWAIKTETGASVLVGGKISSEATSRMSDDDRRTAAMMVRNVAAQDYLEDYLHYLRTVNEVQMNEEAVKGL